MMRTPSRRKRDAIGIPARLGIVGALAALLVLGALSITGAAAGGSPASQVGDHGSYVVQHEATVTANAANPGRTHRLVAPGAFVVIVGFAAVAAARREAGRRQGSRRRVEQFHVRLRGPPHLLVAH